MASSEFPKEVPTDPTLPSSSAAGGEDAAPPSKKGAKKAEAKAKKEAEKARKAAERETAAAAQASAASEDLAKDNYGGVESGVFSKIDGEDTELRNIGEDLVDKTIVVRAYLQNSRAQGAKMVFVELREEGNWAVQGVLAASADGKGVSKQMVKWVAGLNLESFVEVRSLLESIQSRGPNNVSRLLDHCSVLLKLSGRSKANYPFFAGRGGCEEAA
jgi:aspartyl-tRNA synthetase